MRPLLWITYTACLIAATSATAGPSPADFRVVADVRGEYTPNVPMAAPLTREIIAEAEEDFGNMRLFDDLGQETPYVIYQQTEAHKAPKSLAFEIVSYDETDGVDVITVRRPGGTPAFREIELVIAGRDFKKHVRVEAGPTPDAMREIAADTIFDFSSRIDLRKTSVAIPETDSAFLRLSLRDDAPALDGPEMRLRYEGLEFWTEGTKDGPFRVERILGWSGERRPAEHYYDHVTIDTPTVIIDEHGDSVIELRGRLPVARVTFEVGNSYYHRRVELLTATDDRGAEYRVAARGTIYKIPGMTESHDKISFNQPSHYLRLKVLNEDNPPLRIRSVKIEWIRRNLYFVPEPGRTYTLHVGSDVVASPHYELGKLIPSDHAKLRHFASLSLEALQPNVGYDPSSKPTKREGLEQAAFVGLVVILACALTIWAVHLLKKMPTETNE